MTTSEDNRRTAHEWMCPNCGDTVTVNDPCESWPCAVCGEEMVPRDKSDVTPNEELRELIKLWRRLEETAGPGHYIFSECANDLEELIDDE